MKIYVITDGDYSSYHICAVADNKKRAKELQNFFKADNIEIYDTEELSDIFEKGYKEYSCHMYKNGMIEINEPISNHYLDFHVRRMGSEGNKFYTLDVIAKDKEHAQKIFTDKVAEYKARYKLI